MSRGTAVVISCLICACALRAHGAAMFQPLGDLPGGEFGSGAAGVSGEGSVVVGTGSIAGSPSSEGFRWSTGGGGMVPLGDLPGSSYYSYAAGASHDGSVVVGSSSATAGITTYRWTAGSGMVALPMPTGSFATWGNDVSADGNVVVGEASLTAGGAQAFRWTQGTGSVMLGNIPVETQTSVITASAGRFPTH